MRTRRHLLRDLGFATAALAVPRFVSGSGQPASALPPSVNGSRLRSRLEALSLHGRPAGQGFEAGVSRVAYSDADVAGRRYVMDLMRAAGLTPRIDPAGNIFGRREGSLRDAPHILFGSHIDSVPQGGNFDGDLGSLAALEALEVLRERAQLTRHPLEMVVWAHEEGVAFGRGLAGSRIVAGDLAPGDLQQVWNGLRRDDAIRKIGGDPVRIDEATRTPGAYHSYLELHIEQGGTLHRGGHAIGVVQGIVAIDGFEVVVRGFANHAGTTPMGERQDALVAASRLTLAVREIVTARPGRHVGTVGRLEVSPNAPNVIPGEVRLSIELRDLDPATLRELASAITARASQIARDTRTEIVVTPNRHNPPAVADVRLQDLIAAAAGRRELDAIRMPSGAGHDAQMLARLCPMGMIFVPSIDGISHSPRERTTWEDCTRGAQALLDTVLAVDREL